MRTRLPLREKNKCKNDTLKYIKYSLDKFLIII